MRSGDTRFYRTKFVMRRLESLAESNQSGIMGEYKGDSSMEIWGYNEAVKAWVNEVMSSRGIDAERTLRCCLDIEEYALKKNDQALLGFACFYSGETYYLLNDGENLFRYITRAISYLDQSEQWELVARAYNIMGITSYSRGNAPIAMDYYLTGLNYAKKYELTYEENLLNQNLGTLYMNHGQYLEALPYFERSHAYLHSEEGKACSDPASRISVYNNLGKCYMYRGAYDKAQECIDHLDGECKVYMEEVDQLYVDCFKAKFYHLTKHMSLRDECINEVHKLMSECLPIMDIYDDIYDLCQLLLQIGKDEIFWDILSVMDELTKRSKIINLQRKLIALKLKYYRAHEDNAGYLQAAGLYYELTERLEQESQDMIMNMMKVRDSLEKAREQNRKDQEENYILQRRSETDQMTGLPNRYKLNEHSEKIFEYCVSKQSPLAVEILDIDYFKQYNDNYGHQEGDNCLIAVADVIKKMADDKTFCARYGGDEFIIIYADMTKDEVFQKAKKLRNDIMALDMKHEFSKELQQITISQGICYDIPTEEQKNWAFLHRADAMLYEVKRQSRNNVIIGNLIEEKKR